MGILPKNPQTPTASADRCIQETARHSTGEVVDFYPRSLSPADRKRPLISA